MEFPRTSDWRFRLRVRSASSFISPLNHFKKKAGMMWYDTGCRRCVAGPDEHKKMTAYLFEYGYQPVKIDINEEFIFGDGEVSRARVAWLYPVFLDGVCVGAIDIAEVTVPCPCLFSLAMAKKWQIITNHVKQRIHLGLFKHDIPFVDGVPYIDVFDKIEACKKAKVPQQFLL